MNKKTKNLYYWSIQLIVWVSLSSFMAIGYWVSGNVLEMKLWQIVLDFSAIVVLSIMFTHLLKKSINRLVKFDNLKAIDGIKIIGLLALATILFYVFYMLYLQFAYNIIYKRPDVFNHPTQSLANNIVFVLNYGIYFLIWTVFYVAIKGLVKLNASRERQLELESSLKESKLNTLKGQINPHFMFNSLNNIRGLMLEDVNKSRDMLTRLSETLRYSLAKNDVNSIALEDELEMVDNYVEISKIQLEDRLQFKADIDQESLNTQIPPMIIQMLIENAIKHGIANLKKGGTVELITKIEQEKLHITVSNSGTLKQTVNTTQLGLENIKQRLQLLYGKLASFDLFEENNQVVASIKIPLS